MRERLRILLFGRPLKDSELPEQKLNVLWGIPIFASDSISTVSYAGEEILLVLFPVLGAAAYGRFLPIVFALIALLAVLIVCYRHTIDAYPRGGGAYTVAHDNLGETPALVAGGSLVIGYVLTVAVSVSEAAAAVTSAFPALLPRKTLIALLLILLLSWGNLRGVRESAVLFGAPTWFYVLTMLILIVTGLSRAPAPLPPVGPPPAAEGNNGALLLLTLRAFASGCTALAGVEAVANGTSAFKAPAQRTAKRILLGMGLIMLLLFGGVSLLITLYRIVPEEESTAFSQLAGAIFGHGSAMYYIVQIMTVLILALAANTAFADLPHLMAMMAKDGYLPRRLIFRGSRLNYSNGIALLFAASALLVIGFQANQHRLLPLLASGVFISFLLNEYGMFLRFLRNREPGWRRKAAVNAAALLVTGLTLLNLILTRFTSGAWVTLLSVALMTVWMRSIRHHYRDVRADLRLPPDADAVREMLSTTRSRKVILPVRVLDRSFIKALNCARDIGFSEIELYHVAGDEASALRLREQIDALGLDVDFVYQITEYRNTEDVLIRHIEEEHQKLAHHEHLTVMIPSLVTKDPLKQYLHNEMSQILLRRMEQYRYVYIFQVPYLLE